MEKETSSERIKKEIKSEKANQIPFYKSINFVQILTFFIGIIALSLLLWIILPNSLGYAFHFKNVTYSFHLKYPMIVLPYIGLITAIVLIVKKKKFKWLLIFSIFSITFPFITPIIKYVNQTFNTNMSEKLQDSTTPLAKAVHSNQIEKIKKLLENGANPNESFTYEPELIYFAVKNNNIKVTKLLIKYGAEVNRYDYLSGTPLHLAVTNNNIEIINLLLKNNALVNVKTKYHEKKRPAFTTRKDFGKTPLHIAVQNNNEQITKLLLEHGANPNIKDNSEKTPFDYAKGDNIISLLKNYNTVK
jgi:hypothetical protein